MKMLIAALALTLLAGTAKADEVYTYTGPAPADLSGSFTTSAMLAPDGSNIGSLNTLFTDVLSWNFTDGVDVWTPANSSFYGGAYVKPDGSFMFWDFTLGGAAGIPFAFSQTSEGEFYYQDDSPLGDSWVANQFLPVGVAKPKGSWTMTDLGVVSTPEPGTLALLGVGLAGFALKRKKRVDTTVWEPLA